MKSYYKTLGVKRDATADDIKSAYRTIAKENHPDVSPGDEKRAAKFRAATEAYDCLMDPDQRRQHDELLAQDSRGRRKADPFDDPFFAEGKNSDGFSMQYSYNGNSYSFNLKSRYIIGLILVSLLLKNSGCQALKSEWQKIAQDAPSITDFAKSWLNKLSPDSPAPQR